MAGYAQGTAALRPAAGKAGRIYRATDTGEVTFDTGSGWITIGPSRGKSIIATEESRSSSSYGLMTTPDRVSGIVLPTDGLLRIHYAAEIKGSSGNNARAAIFIGSNQLKIAANNSASPIAAETQILTQASNAYNRIATFEGGLLARGSLDPSNAAIHPTYTGDVTTGQASYVDFVTQPTDGASTGAYAVQVGGGFCLVEAAAGTYDISVQFAAVSSGSVSVRNRRLRVDALAY
jgi:hypothetical protein